MFKKFLYVTVLICIANTGLAQNNDSIPKYYQDSIPEYIDFTNVPFTDTLVIRKEQFKVKNIPRGVQLRHPKISFNSTKPLTKKFKRFRVPSFWEKKNILGVNVNQVSFVNWNAGGNNSISALTNVKFERNYKFRYISWKNLLELKYGLNAQEGQKLRKTDDAVRFSSTFGFRLDTISNWYYSARANFNTQFTNGYKYPNRTKPISRFMAPGYFFLGAGTSYISEDNKFNLYISPLTLKATVVLDETLARKGSFGLKKAVVDADGNILVDAKKHFTELGFLITNTYEAEISKNVELNNRISFYTDYLQSFGNIDVDWQLEVKFQVNKYIATTLGTHIIYDDDILFDEQVDANGFVLVAGKPRIQFKQLFGVGVSYNF